MARRWENVCMCPSGKNRGNMDSNLSQHPEIVPVDKLISLNINVERFIPDAAGSERRTGMLWIQGWKFPPNHQIWQQRKTQIDCLNELNTHAHAHTHSHMPTHTDTHTHTRVLDLMSLLTIFLIHLSAPETHTYMLTCSFSHTHRHTQTHTGLYDQSTSNTYSFKYSYKVLEDGWSISLSPFPPPPPLCLSPGVLIIPPVSPPHRVGGFSLQTKFLEVSIN